MTTDRPFAPAQTAMLVRLYHAENHWEAPPSCYRERAEWSKALSALSLRWMVVPTASGNAMLTIRGHETVLRNGMVAP